MARIKDVLKTVKLQFKYDWAEIIDGSTNKKISELANELNVVIVSCYYEYVLDGVYFSSAAVFDADGALLGNENKE